MLEMIAIVLVVMWVMGMGTGYMLGGFIHVLLVVAVISVLLRVISGRKLLT